MLLRKSFLLWALIALPICLKSHKGAPDRAVNLRYLGHYLYDIWFTTTHQFMLITTYVCELSNLIEHYEEIGIIWVQKKMWSFVEASVRSVNLPLHLLFPHRTQWYCVRWLIDWYAILNKFDLISLEPKLVRPRKNEYQDERNRSSELRNSFTAKVFRDRHWPT